MIFHKWQLYRYKKRWCTGNYHPRKVNKWINQTADGFFPISAKSAFSIRRSHFKVIVRQALNLCPENFL